MLPFKSKRVQGKPQGRSGHTPPAPAPLLCPRHRGGRFARDTSRANCNANGVHDVQVKRRPRANASISSKHQLCARRAHEHNKLVRVYARRIGPKASFAFSVCSLLLVFLPPLLRLARLTSPRPPDACGASAVDARVRIPQSPTLTTPPPRHVLGFALCARREHASA